MMLEREPFQLAQKPRTRFEPGRTPCNTLSAMIVRGQGPKSPKIRDHLIRICWHASSPEDDRLLLLDWLQEIAPLMQKWQNDASYFFASKSLKLIDQFHATHHRYESIADTIV
jgi:hypothetical protein